MGSSQALASPVETEQAHSVQQAEPASSNEAPTDIRMKLLGAGYRPIPAKGKSCQLPRWTELRANAADIRSWNGGRFSGDRNTGIVLGEEVRVIDMDIMDQHLAQMAEDLVRVFCGRDAPVRYGQSPKRCLFFRTDVGRPKAKLSLGTGNVEFLGAGQQVIVHGIHPQTMLPYRWEDAPLWERSLSSLPVLDAETEAALVAAMAALATLHCPTKKERTVGSGPGVSLPGAATPPNVLTSDQRREGLLQRNDTLFELLKEEALDCPSVAELLSIGLGLNETFTEQLSVGEVLKTVNSVWRYKMNGKLMLAGDARILIPKDEVLLRNPDVLALYARLSAAHGAEPGKWIGVASKNMERLMGMNEHRIRRARNALQELGYLKLMKRGGRGPNQPHRYVLHPRKLGT
jgi:hypothetical protein